MERDYAQKHVQIKEIPYRYLFMHKNMCELRKGKKLWTIKLY